MRLLIMVVVLFLNTLSWTVEADMVVVVSKNSSFVELTERQIKRIFLSKTRRLSNGSRIQTLELSNTDLKAQFYEKVAGKNLRQLNSYWTTLIFTGKGKPPKNVDKAEALLNELSENPSAIAYVPVEYLDDRLKVVHRVQ